MDRFIKNIKAMSPGQCWLWVGPKNKKGYGQFWFNGRGQRAHRVAYQLFVGSIPENAWVLHKCDTPACVNTEHLFLGNNALNVADKVAKGRHRSSKLKAKVCPLGHEYAGDNLLLSVEGWSICRICRDAKNKKYNARRAVMLRKIRG